MKVLVTILVSCYYILSVNGIASEDLSVCKNGESFREVNINCTIKEMIHIESIEYTHTAGCNETCGQPLSDNSTDLMSSCIGQSSCTQRIPNNSNCTETIVNDRCIEMENVKDICHDNFELNQSTQIFLSSPGYPAANGLTGESCECSIRGKNITSITILDLRLNTSSDGTRSNLFIQYGDINYNQTSKTQPTLQVYNYKLQTKATTTIPPTTAGITFTHKQVNELKLWIEIEGTGLTVVCNKPTTAPTLSSTHSEVSSTSPSNHTENTTASSTANNHMMPSSVSSDPTSKPSTSPTANGVQEADHDILLIVGCVVGGLVLISILVAVCVAFRIRRNKDNVRQQNLDVRVHINNTPHYFMLDVPVLNTQDPDEQQSDITPMTTRRIPEYAVVNKNGKRFNVAGGNSPKQLSKRKDTDVSEMEILENDLYVPYESPSNPGPHGASSTGVPSTERASGEMEIMENELYVPFESSSNPGAHDASSTGEPTTERASGEMEIMENDLYIPFGDSAITASKPLKNEMK